MTSNFTTKNDGITYYFGKNVKPESQKAIQDALSEVKEKSWKNKNFFDDLNIHVSRNWEEIDKNYDWQVAAFTRDPIVTKGQKEIYLRTDVFLRLTVKPFALKMNLLHEMGHLFDIYFATPDPELVDKIKGFIKSVEDYDALKNDSEVSALLEQYYKQDGLNDSEEFKEAWKKDVQIAFMGKSKKVNKNLSKELGYFSPKFDFSKLDNDNVHNELKLENGIDDTELEDANDCRREVFAQLFAYAMGAEDLETQKQLIVNTYKHSYEVVKKYINEYLGTNTKGHYVPRTQNKLDCTM